MRRHPLPSALTALAALLCGACRDDAAAVDEGSTAPDPSPLTTSSSETMPVGTLGFTSAAGTTMSADSTTGGTHDDGNSGMIEPPIFDVSASDAPLYDPYGADVSAVLFADGAYMLAYGSSDTLEGAFDVVDAPPLPKSCGLDLEAYVVPGAAPYIYVVAYAPPEGTHGVLGVFTRDSFRSAQGDPPPLEEWEVYTGDSAWMVCATGHDFDPGDPPPSPALVEAYIVQCNRSIGDPETTSGGWVDVFGTPLGALAVGESNETPLGMGPQPGNEFPLVCADLMPSAEWMWFNWAPDTLVWPVDSPFMYPSGDDQPAHEFLIFRLPREAIP